MEFTTTHTYEDMYYNEFWNISDNLTYYYYLDLEEYGELLKFIHLTRIIIPILIGLFVIFGMVGNIFTIAVILRRKADRGTPKYLILNMATTDLLYVVFCVSFEAVYPAVHSWPFGDIWCWIHTYLGYVFYFAKIYTLVLISMDRYIAIVHPMRDVILSTKVNCYIALVSLWSLVILETMLFLSMAKQINEDLNSFDEGGKVCSIYFDDAYRFSIFLFIFSYLLPLLVLFVLYGHMLKVSLTGKSLGPSNNGDEALFQSAKRITKMAMMMVAAFAVSWLPLHIIMLNIHVSKTKHATVTFASIVYAAKCMVYMNSCINPILYTFYIHPFRNGIKNALCCRKTTHLKPSSNSSEITSPV